MHKLKGKTCIRTYGLGIAVLAAVAVATLSGSCLFDTKYILCEKTDLVCPMGWFCTAKQDGCTRDGCGNGTMDHGEACDDGNRIDGDDCDNNCTRSACGNGIKASDEVCDDGNNVDGDGCDSNCMPSGCGNGVRDSDEQCDDGDTADGDGCDRNCTKSSCGNGVRAPGEQCDDGNLSNDDGCVDDCVFARCGDGYVQVGIEDCDDGNNTTEVCPYGELSCGYVCDSACRRVLAEARYCGDGTVQSPHERCDDGNKQACGTCRENCSKSITKQERGGIVTVSANSMDDNDQFTLRDGILTVVFKYTTNAQHPVDSETTRWILVQKTSSAPGDGPVDVASKTISAINAHVSLRITADYFGSAPINIVEVTHDQFGDFDHEAVKIDDDVSNSGFSVYGMGGGAGSLCGSNVGCMSNADCSSNSCVNMTATMPGHCE